MHKSLEKNLPFLIEKFSSSGNSIDQRWLSILQHFFADCVIEATEQCLEKCQIGESPSQLLVPSIQLNHGYLISTDEPDSSFNQEDIELASSLLQLTKQFISIEEAIEKGAAEERLRIARDLHDDVAARMLTLIHSVKDEHTIALARSILKSLRNSIYTLDNKSTATILDAITDARSELQDRLNQIGMQLIWQQSDRLEGLTFTPRQHINLNRMLHEITTNTIRHAKAQYMEVNIDIKHQNLIVVVCDNGQGFNIENCIPGKGINNIITRAQELNGHASWHPVLASDSGENQGSCVKISFMISNTTE